jgi:hypothetical protein
MPNTVWHADSPVWRNRSTTYQPPDDGGARFPGDPGAGKFYYGSSREGGDPSDMEDLLGFTLPLYRSYAGGGVSMPDWRTIAQRCHGNHTVPWLSTKVPNNNWAEVADGSQDTWLMNGLNGLKTLSGPTWATFHHEPNGEVNASAGRSIADWVAMQQHIRDKIEADSALRAKVTLVGCLNGWISGRDYTSSAWTSWRHPVGTGVDVFGADRYNGWSPVTGGTWITQATWRECFDSFVSWGYPTAAGEWGVRGGRTAGQAAAWMEAMYDTVLDVGNFVAVSYFNSSANSPEGTWDLRRRPVTADTSEPDSPNYERWNEWITQYNRAQTYNVRY